MSLAAFSVDGLAPEEAARVFDTHGLALLGRLAPAGWVDAARVHVLSRLDALLSALRSSGRDLGLYRDGGFREVVQRSPRRYDLALPDASPRLDTLPAEGPPGLLPLLSAILGPDFAVRRRGAVVALPGAEEQPWHIDWEHLFGELGTPLPPHCVNVFVPLVDVTPAHGPTELAPGSHRPAPGTVARHADWSDSLEAFGFRGGTVAATIPAGSCLLFDYRTLHRALPNLSAEPRPVLYLVASRPWYRDVTFPAREALAGDP